MSIELPRAFFRGSARSSSPLLPIRNRAAGIRRSQMDVQSIAPAHKKPSLDSEFDADWGTIQLKKVAADLLSYKPPINFLGLEEDADEQDGAVRDGDDGDARAASLSEAVLKELPKDIGKKKAAVLVCLFQDDDGKLRVILSRRAKALSSHSGTLASISL